MDSSSAWEEIAAFQENHITTLGAIHASSEEQRLVHEFVQKVPLQTLFECLQQASTVQDDQLVKQVCKCIDRVLGAEESGAVFFHEQMIPYFLAGLGHEEKQARLLTVGQLQSHIQRQPTPEQVQAVANDDLVSSLVATVSDEDTEVASKASSILVKFSSLSPTNLCPSVLEAIHAKLQESDASTNSIEYMRYLECIANICELGNIHAEYVVQTGAADILLNCLNSKDSLFLLNVVDVLPKLCQTKPGVQHVFKSGTIGTLLGLVNDTFVGGTVVRQIGEMSALAAKIGVESRSWQDPTLSKLFLDTVLAKLTSGQERQQIAAMDAIAGYCCSSPDELEKMMSIQPIREQWLSFRKSSSQELKTNCLHSIARILRHPTVLVQQTKDIPRPDAKVWTTNESLFDALGGDVPTITFLMKALSSPFPEVRSAVFNVLQAVAAQHHKFGLARLMGHGGMFEFLMDRTTEPTKETREWKFAVVDAVIGNPLADTVLDEGLRGQLKAHLQLGPYVGKLQTGAAMEAA